MVAPKRKISAVITLFFVAPLVAEYLLGDLPLKLLPVLIVLAPAYGGAAVLIRDAARRAGRGWPAMLMLGTAYTLIGEGLVTQSLFNPDYLRKHWHLLYPAYIPALGIGGWWTLFMFNLHTFWSVGVSIALVEALFPAEAEAPWLGPVGDSVVALVFVLGSAASFGIGYKQNQFVASHAQLLGAAALSVLLMVSAFLIPVPGLQPGSRRTDGRVPSPRIASPWATSPWTTSPWITGAVAFVLGMGVLHAPLIGAVGMGVFHAPLKWGWAAVGAMLLFDAIFLVLVTYFSQQPWWSALHVLSLAAGGSLAYGVHAFTAKPLVGGLLWMRISNTVFLAAALGLIGLAARRVIRYQTQA